MKLKHCEMEHNLLENQKKLPQRLERDYIENLYFCKNL